MGGSGRRQGQRHRQRGRKTFAGITVGIVQHRSAVRGLIICSETDEQFRGSEEYRGHEEGETSGNPVFDLSGFSWLQGDPKSRIRETRSKKPMANSHETRCRGQQSCDRWEEAAPTGATNIAYRDDDACRSWSAETMTVEDNHVAKGSIVSLRYYYYHHHNCCRVEVSNVDL